VRASDLVEDYPTVRPDTPAAEAAAMIGGQRRPGVVVLDDDGLPVAVLGASQVLRFVIPGYLQDEPSLAAVYDEETADRCAARLQGRSVQDLLPHEDDRQQLPVVEPDANVLECAAVMASLHSPLLVVRDGGRTLGVVTASKLLSVLVG
jgi:CBS domain-containing protein